MDENKIKAAIAVCENEIKKMTEETIRRNYGLKMRNYAETILAMTQLISYYENELVKLKPKGPLKSKVKEAVNE